MKGDISAVVLWVRVIGIGILCWLVADGLIIPLIKSSGQDGEVNGKVANEYLSIFDPQVSKACKIIESYSVDGKGEYLEFSCNKTRIFMHRANVTPSHAAPKWIALKRGDGQMSPGEIYAGSEDSMLKFLYSKSQMDKVEKVVVKFDGDILRYKKLNDGLIQLNLLAKAVGVKYASDFNFTVAVAWVSIGSA